MNSLYKNNLTELDKFLLNPHRFSIGYSDFLNKFIEFVNTKGEQNLTNLTNNQKSCYLAEFMNPNEMRQKYIDYFNDNISLKKKCKKNLHNKFLKGENFIDSDGTVIVNDNSGDFIENKFSECIDFLIKYDIAVSFSLIYTFSLTQLQEISNNFLNLSQIKYDSILQIITKNNIVVISEAKGLSQFIRNNSSDHEIYSNKDDDFLIVIHKNVLNKFHIIQKDPITNKEIFLDEQVLLELHYVNTIPGENTFAFILQGIHFTSKNRKKMLETTTPLKNYDNQYLEVVNSLNEKYGEDIPIIISGDFNHRPKQNNALSIFPNEPTTRKRRFISVQTDKINVDSTRAGDGSVIFGNSNYISNIIHYIEDFYGNVIDNINVEYLPSTLNPSDHFLTRLRFELIRVI
jgi:hypothetical protein